VTVRSRTESIDGFDNIWVADNGAHFVLKASPEGRISMVLGQKDDELVFDRSLGRPRNAVVLPEG
jgi:hypothetical protein